MPDYSFYTTQYLGDSITGDDFPRLKKRAADQLARYKRMYTVTAPDEEAEMMAICAMADALYYYETLWNEPSGNISSASIGSVSVSYNGVDASPKAQERELLRCARLYLDVYRGCGV